MAQPGEQDLGVLLEALQALQAKRQPLLDRLRTIEEKKSAVAAHIYEKFRRETLDRLEAIAEEARGHRAQALLARDAVAERRASLDRDLARVNEELEEIRFRNTLGEFTPGEFEHAESDKLAEIQRVEATAGPLLELAKLLETIVEGGPSAPHPGPVPVPPPPSYPVAVPHAAEYTRPQPLPPLPVAQPQPVAAPQPIRSPASEMEALFGSAPVAVPHPRPVAVPSPAPRPEPLAPLFPGPVNPPPARAGGGPVPLSPEETTQDLGIRQASRPGFPEAAATARPVLIVKTKDKDRGEDTYDLAAGQTLIGRAPENDIILLEESVSRRHARIHVEASDCTIEDLGSANGSYVNGEKLRPKQPRKLQDNDVVKMGQLLALFRLNPED